MARAPKAERVPLFDIDAPAPDREQLKRMKCESNKACCNRNLTEIVAALIVMASFPVIALTSPGSLVGTLTIILVILVVASSLAFARACVSDELRYFNPVCFGSDQRDRYRTLISLPEEKLAPVVRMYLKSLVASDRDIPVTGEVHSMTQAQCRWEVMRTTDDLVLDRPDPLFETEILKPLREALDRGTIKEGDI